MNESVGPVSPSCNSDAEIVAGDGPIVEMFHAPVNLLPRPHLMLSLLVLGPRSMVPLLTKHGSDQSSPAWSASSRPEGGSHSNPTCPPKRCATQMVMEIGSKQLPIKHIPGPEGVRGRNSDNAMIREKLGWEPTITLKDGLT